MQVSEECSDEGSTAMPAGKLLALIILIVVVVVCLLFFLHAVVFDTAMVLLVASIGFLLSAERLIT